VQKLNAAAEKAVKDGAEIIVLSDFNAGGIKVLSLLAYWYKSTNSDAAAALKVNANVHPAGVGDGGGAPAYACPEHQAPGLDCRRDRSGEPSYTRIAP
jgi:hypothetical protein